MAAGVAVPETGVDAGAARRVQRHLLDWYATHARDLPWRRTRDAYAILVAEIMLQQTQVERVIPKWHAWLERFPAMRDLALASRADAIRAWQGLGYNQRAVRLHAIARQVMAEHGGVLPRSVADLQTLKGVGRYTAAAVACFAYEQPVAMVETNIRRVLSRVFSVPSAAVDALASNVMPEDNAYTWNQGLMDVGATLCRPQRPLCLLCPLVGDCGGPSPTAGRKPANGPSEEFRSSSRHYRGRLIDALRQVPRGHDVVIDELVAEIGGSSEQARVKGLIDRLAAEGLVAIDAQKRVRLAE